MMSIPINGRKLAAQKYRHLGYGNKNSWGLQGYNKWSTLWMASRTEKRIVKKAYTAAVRAWF